MNRALFIFVGIAGGVLFLLASRRSEAAFEPYGEIAPSGASLADDAYAQALISAGYDPALYGFGSRAPLDPWADYDAALSDDFALDFDQVYPIYEPPEPAAEAYYPEPVELIYEDTGMSGDDNVNAFLALIRLFEAGTAGPMSYSTLIGGAQFSSFIEHPFLLDPTKPAIQSGSLPASKAAGAYQFLPQTWTEARDALGLPDFSPASQDAAALFLIRRRGALTDVQNGEFARAILKLGREWASLPGSPYGQTSKTLAQAETAYVSFGGQIA